MRNERKSNWGFTLIELLVVIAIIALLAAILFPVFAAARAKSYQAVCTSNQHQIGLAILMYMQDNNERLLAGEQLTTTDPVTGKREYGGWAGPTNLYVRDPHVFACPTDTTPQSVIQGQTAYPCTYFLNLNLGGEFWPEGMPYAGFSVPATTVLTTESTLGFSHPNVRIENATEADSVMADAFDTSQPGGNRHQGGRVFLMADGHAKWVHPEDVSTGVQPGFGPGAAALPTNLPAGAVATFAY